MEELVENEDEEEKEEEEQERERKSLNTILPNELLIVIFNYLDFVSRQKARQVCKRWQLLIPPTPRGKLTLLVCDEYRCLVSRKTLLFPTLGYLDGQTTTTTANTTNYPGVDETLALTTSAAVSFLSTFCNLTQFSILCKRINPLVRCLDVIQRKWSTSSQESVSVEFEPEDCESITLLALRFPSVVKLITSLRLPLPPRQGPGSFLKPFTSLRFLYIPKGYATVSSVAVRDSFPPTLQGFWCAGATFSENALNAFTETLGVNLQIFSASYLNEADLQILARWCPRIKSLRLDYVRVNHPMTLSNTLKQFTRIEHLGLTNSRIYLQQQQQEEKPFKFESSTLLAWPNLESLYLSRFGINVKTLTEIAKASCPKLKAVNFGWRLPLETANDLQHLLSLSNQLESIAFCFNAETLLPLLRQVLPKFNKVTHFLLKPSKEKNYHQDMEELLRLFFSLLASTNPKRSIYVTWCSSLRSGLWPEPCQISENLYLRFWH